LYYQNFISMTSGKVISENIKRLRAKLGLTQDDLTKKADIKYTTLMKVESGPVNRPSVQTMAKIAKALGVSIEELIK
jgi:transcriptional regulator with XRE-family HTH domain